MAATLGRVRSLLFSPGNVVSMLLKGHHSGCDAQVLDLEDSVPVAAKTVARQAVHDFLEARVAQLGQGRSNAHGQGPLLIPRVNSLRSGLFADDIERVCHKAAAAITIPKIETKDEMLEWCAPLPRALHVCMLC